MERKIAIILALATPPAVAQTLPFQGFAPPADQQSQLLFQQSQLLRQQQMIDSALAAQRSDDAFRRDQAELQRQEDRIRPFPAPPEALGKNLVDQATRAGNLARPTPLELAIPALGPLPR